MREYAITTTGTLAVIFVIWFVFFKEDTVLTTTSTLTATASGTVGDDTGDATDEGEDTGAATSTLTSTETQSRSDEQDQSTSTSTSTSTNVSVERGPEGCPTTKGFLEQVCAMDGVTFERLKGASFRRYPARDPMVVEGWGPDALKSCIDACKEDDDCKGVSVRSEGLGESSSHHCTFHTNLNLRRTGPQYRSYCLDDVEQCSGDDIVTDQDSQYWG